VSIIEGELFVLFFFWLRRCGEVVRGDPFIVGLLAAMTTRHERYKPWTQGPIACTAAVAPRRSFSKQAILFHPITENQDLPLTWGFLFLNSCTPTTNALEDGLLTPFFLAMP